MNNNDIVTARLCEAAASGDLETVRRLSMPFFVQRPDTHGYTPLATAAKHGQDEVCKVLLSEFRVDADGDRSHRPLIEAIKNAHYTTIKLLLISGANPSAKDEEGRNALHHAVKEDNPAVVQLIGTYCEHTRAFNEVDKGRSYTPLAYAVKRGRQDMVDALLHFCPSHLNLHMKFGRERYSYLHLAIISNKVKIVRTIDEANPALREVRNKEGLTPSEMCANLHRSENIQRYLSRPPLNAHAEAEGGERATTQHPPPDIRLRIRESVRRRAVQAVAKRDEKRRGLEEAIRQARAKAEEAKRELVMLKATQREVEARAKPKREEYNKLKALSSTQCLHADTLKGLLKTLYASKTFSPPPSSVATVHTGSDGEGGEGSDAVALAQRQLRIELESAERDKECVICMHEQADAVFGPCGHQRACLGCAGQLMERQGHAGLASQLMAEKWATCPPFPPIECPFCRAHVKVVCWKVESK
mmetsp:Transcript_5831/g.13789  ORF Transcript_5831/g.13789 Transcript_5831/m.13789 type:complete len:473 (-) Transcript_5831:456-1874(-)